MGISFHGSGSLASVHFIDQDLAPNERLTARGSPSSPMAAAMKSLLRERHSGFSSPVNVRNGFSSHNAPLSLMSSGASEQPPSPPMWTNLASLRSNSPYNSPIHL